MSTTNLFSTLARALPKGGSDGRIDLPSLPAYSLTEILGTDHSDGSTASDLLQNTLKETSNAIAQNNRQLSDLHMLQQQLVETIVQNTRAVDSNTDVKASTGSNALAAAGNAVSGMFGGSLLSPIISGLVSLFGGHKETAEPTFTPFVMPAPINVESVVARSAAPSVAPPSVNEGNNGNRAAASGVAQVQVQVNAIDSRSFLDHSDAIADAVRRALLNSHSLGDVIAEL